MSTSIPSTPHNQKRDSKSGPIANVISTLRKDNRDQLLSLLSLDPQSNDVQQKMMVQDFNTSSSSSGMMNDEIQGNINHRQRLIFATDSLRKLLLYHTLFHHDRQSSSKQKRSTGNKIRTTYAHLTHEELALGLDAFNPYGIVNTRILFPNNNNTTSHNHNHNMTANGKNKHNGESSVFNIEHDLIQDADSGAISVILYFILPLPDHVKAVCKIIQSYTSQIKSSTTNATSTKIKHRIIFLSRCTKLCTQILYNENILPLPEYNNDNIVLNKKTTGVSSSSTTAAAAAAVGSTATTNLVNLQKNIVVHTLDIDLIPIEDDILTLLDSSTVMKDVSSIHGIPSSHVNCIASSIMKIQTIANSNNNHTNDNDGGKALNPNGFIPRIQSFGRVSESVVKRCFDLRLEEYYFSCMNSNNDKNGIDGEGNDSQYNRNQYNASSGDIQAMMVLDRRVDLVTPMLTPLTYEGLLDDVLSIETGILHVKTDIINPPDEEEDSGSRNDKSSLSNRSKGSKEKPPYTLLPLNDQDTLYVEVRDQHVEKFGSFLQEQAKALKESHANFSNKDKDLTEIHQFVKQIPIFTQNLKSLTHHIHLAELIKHTTIQSEFRQRWQLERSIVESESCFDAIEDLIASHYNVWRVLRLLCLHSLTNGGIKTSKLDALKREVVQTYGYEFVFLLQNLESIGLLRKKDTLWDTSSSSAYGTLRKQLQLIQPDVDPLNPDDVSYVSSGYAPISARIIQTSMRGWSGKEESLKELPGRGIDVDQKYPPEEYNVAMKQKVGSSLGEWAKQLKSNPGPHTDNGRQQKKPVLLVYFVGGITYAEIAAIRFMSKRSSFPYQIVCCTTKIINGTTLLQSLI